MSWPDLCISIHALREEGDPGVRLHFGRSDHISIHALREEGDWSRSSPCTARRYFYPRPPRGGRPPGRSGCNGDIKISIHALREEGDFLPNAELTADGEFLSTPSARRATQVRRDQWRVQMYFYPRPPRGGRPDVVIQPQLVHSISIHALREEGDRKCAWSRTSSGAFLSTPSARRATPFGEQLGDDIVISIHALREEGDLTSILLRFWGAISIHALREEGDGAGDSCGLTGLLFLSTPSARRATPPPRVKGRKKTHISIHALREEGDN